MRRFVDRQRRNEDRQDDEDFEKVDVGHAELNIRAYHAIRAATRRIEASRRAASACVVRKLTMHARNAKRPLMVAFERYDSPSRWTSTISCLLKASSSSGSRKQRLPPRYRKQTMLSGTGARRSKSSLESIVSPRCLATAILPSIAC